MSILILRRCALKRIRHPRSFHSSAFWYAKKLETFNLADIGEGITECEVIRWTVEPNSTVQAFDMLCEVQSDKATVEITSPFDGVVKALMVKEGEVAQVGSGLCQIETEDDSPESEQSSAPEPAADPTPSEPTPAAAPPQEPQQAVETSSKSAAGLHPLAPGYVPNPKEKDVLCTPSVRHFARSQGVDLANLVPGSGKAGRIERKDVDAYLAGKATSSQPSQTSSTLAPVSVSADDALVQLGRTRYGMWKAMTKSLEIPHFGYTTSLDLTSLHALLPLLNANIPSQYLPEAQRKTSSPIVSPSSIYPAPSLAAVNPGAQFSRLTYLPFLLKTLSKAMIEWPLFRSSISLAGDKPALAIRPSADISIALSTPTGLYTPTIQAVSTTLPTKAHDLYSVASTLAHLSTLGRQTPCGLSPREMPRRGGTVTVSNVGAIGQGEAAVPRLVEGGGVAIAAIGRAKWVWDVDRNPEGERRLRVGVSWSADHRVVEGAELAAFVESWRSYVEKPERLIAEAV